ncbi:hypothetical protein [Spiroplasma endosymbiont of Eupeodes luniger]|uniref:hypothetical protein n=1 Tax=Spiroplasma endosymbiont of Eupeodes luniger TaxID=3066300 RepID=UPI0030CD9313
MRNQSQDKENICTYVNIWIPKGTTINSRTINIVNKLVNLVKTNDILGFKEKYEAITNYNFVNNAIEYYVGNYHYIFSRKKFNVDFLVTKTRKMLSFLKKSIYKVRVLINFSKEKIIVKEQ